MNVFVFNDRARKIDRCKMSLELYKKRCNDPVELKKWFESTVMLNTLKKGEKFESISGKIYTFSYTGKNYIIWCTDKDGNEVPFGVSARVRKVDWC